MWLDVFAGLMTLRARELHQGRFLESSTSGDATLLLWAPYSVFTVEKVELAAENSYLNPHVITLRAAVDNRLEPEDLPLAPWY